MAGCEKTSSYIIESLSFLKNSHQFRGGHGGCSRPEQTMNDKKDRSSIIYSDKKR
jgi:hypothetical protein